MDPVSAIGLASSIVQLIAFTSDLLSKAHKIHNSADGALIEKLELEAVTESLRGLSLDITSGAQDLTKADKQLKKLCDGCQQVADELLQLIRSLDSSGSYARWKSFRQAVLTVWKEKDIQALCNRLDRYRQQIDTTLLVTLREYVQRPNSQLRQPAGGTSWEDNIIDELQRNDWKEKNTQDMAMFSARFTESAGQHRQQLHQRRIIQNLRFADIADRYESIEEAHKTTFEWIFSENEGQEPHASHPNGLDSRGSPNHPLGFVDWLHSDDDLFWITGKPGAGKSTLMKYLYNDPRTRPLLDSWKGADELVTAAFFFWNSGTVMQMDREGLLRALLYEALQTCPEDVPHLFPDRWGYYELFGADPRPWSWTELSKAFESLIASESKKFFFIIDGLDEFRGNCAELATLITKASSKPNVKLCVASRPWTAFEEAFKSTPSLRVEDLTAPDIHTFTTEKLQASDMFSKLQSLEPESARKLTAEVLEKASGVFLWVRLVVMSLLEGLQDGDTMVDLLERLQQLPPDLENLYQKILDDLTPKYRQQASRLIRIILTPRTQFTLLDLSFAHHTVDEALAANIDPMDSGTADFRAEKARRYLSSRCKGLVEAPNFAQDGPMTTIQFLHRTVRDFVLTPPIQSLFKEIEGDFDPHRSICAAQIFSLKSMYSVEVRPDDELFRYTFEQAAMCSDIMASADDALKAQAITELDKLAHEVAAPYPDRTNESAEWLGYLLIEGTFSWAIKMGFLSYVRHNAAHYELNSRICSRFPLCLAIESLASGNGEEEVESRVDMIRILLKNGADPNRYIGKVASPWMVLMGSGSDRPYESLRLESDKWMHEVLVRNRVVFELFDEHGAAPPLHLEGLSDEEVILKLTSRWLRCYNLMDRISRGRLTRLVANIRKPRALQLTPPRCVAD